MRIGYVGVSSFDLDPDSQIGELKLHQVEKVLWTRCQEKKT